MPPRHARRFSLRKRLFSPGNHSFFSPGNRLSPTRGGNDRSTAFSSSAPPQKKGASALAFAASLTIAMLLFGGAALPWLFSDTSPAETPLSAPEEEPLPLLSLIVFWQGAHGLDGCTVLAADANLGTGTATALPPETEFTVGTEFATLIALCAPQTRAAYAQAAAQVAHLFGQESIHYIVLAPSGRASLLNSLGDNLIFTVPRLGDGVPHPEAGRQTLTASQIEQLLACPASLFSDGRGGVCRLRASLAHALCAQYSVASRNDEGAADFRLLLACAEASDLTIADWEAIKPTLFRLRKQAVKRTVSVVSGEYVGREADLRFYPTSLPE